MHRTEYELKTKDGLILFGVEWMPETDIKAVICLVHGVGEHCERYEHVAKFLADNGFAVRGFDHRGHGKSQGKRGHFASIDVAMDDVRIALEATKEHFPSIPIVLYGHSMGGNFVLNYALRKNPQITGVISTAPMLGLAFEPSKFTTFLAKLLIKIWPTLPLSNGLNSSDISRDPKEVEKYDTDPLNHDRVTPCFMNLVAAGGWAMQHASEFSLPLLLMHGSGDHITSCDNSIEFADKVGEKCTLKVWDGLYHEIHNEPEIEKVLKVMVNWLDLLSKR